MCARAARIVLTLLGAVPLHAQHMVPESVKVARPNAMAGTSGSARPTGRSRPSTWTEAIIGAPPSRLLDSSLAVALKIRRPCDRRSTTSSRRTTTYATTKWSGCGRPARCAWTPGMHTRSTSCTRWDPERPHGRSLTCSLAEARIASPVGPLDTWDTKTASRARAGPSRGRDVVAAGPRR